MKNLNLFNILLLCGCTMISNNRTLKAFINPNNNGWYFIQLDRDYHIIDTGVVNIKFNDTTRLIKVQINHIDKTILSPYDYKGNSLSPRLKYLGILEAEGRQFFEFYNPTNSELNNIKEWSPKDERAWKIRLRENTEFIKYFKASKINP